MSLEVSLTLAVVFPDCKTSGLECYPVILNTGGLYPSLITQLLVLRIAQIYIRHRRHVSLC